MKMPFGAPSGRDLWLLFGASLGFVLLVTPLALAQPPRVPPGWRFTVPAGDATAGKQVFEKMQCYSCHTVRGQRFGEPSQNPGGIGPDLTPAHGRLPAEYLAESIVSSNRVVAHGQFRAAYRAADGRSRMGDYSEIMTVRELIDLVAFLRSLP
jgi:mono/diheme cytochrome c family protein